MTLGELQTQVSREHQRLYFDWAREIIKLAAGALTLTVSLQSFYVKATAHGLWLLAACWIGLTLSLVFGLFVLRGEARLYFDAADALRTLRGRFQDAAIADVLKTEPLAELRRPFVRAYYAMTVAFVVALIGLLLFGIWNLF